MGHEPRVTTLELQGRMMGDAVVALEQLIGDGSAIGEGDVTVPPVIGSGITIGKVTQRDALGRVLVDFPANECGEPVYARSVVQLGPASIGREVALLFEDGRRNKPIVVGVIQESPAPEATSKVIRAAGTDSSSESDGGRVVLSAEREIVLRCGSASITLTRAGKVLIKGEYVLTRANGVNRIKGGSVQIN